MHRSLLLLLLILLLALSGCQQPGSLPDDGPDIPVTEEAAASLAAKVQELPTSGSATLSVTQQEVTSFLALRVLSADLPLQAPQVYFKSDGTLVVRGQLIFQERSQPLRIVATPSTVDGQLQLDVTSARIGPVPVPGSILDSVEGSLAEAITAGERWGRISEVTVGDGTLTIRGERGP